MAKEKEVAERFAPWTTASWSSRSRPQEKTTGGILLPDSAKEKPQRGRVLAVGPGKLRDDGNASRAMAVAKGDEVSVRPLRGNDIDRRNRAREVKIMRESDILAKVVK